MSKSRNLFLSVLALLGGVVVLAGCGQEMISQDEMTANIEKQYKQQTGIEMTKLECDDVKAEKGEKISCKATNANDVNLEITGEVSGKQSGSDKWNFNWQIVSANAPGSLFEKSAATTITNNFGVTVKSVSCPDRIDVKKGTVVYCQATATDGSTNGVKLTLTDANGGYRVILDKK